MDANMQLTINSFRQLFPDKIFSLTFSKIPDISLTAVKFPDISRFSRRVVSLCTNQQFTLLYLRSFVKLFALPEYLMTERHVLISAGRP